MARLLHAAEQDHLQRRHDVPPRSAGARGNPAVQQVGDRAVAAARLQLVEQWAEYLVNLLRAGRADLLPLGIAFEVDDALMQPPEPVAQPGRAEGISRSSPTPDHPSRLRERHRPD